MKIKDTATGAFWYNLIKLYIISGMTGNINLLNSAKLANDKKAP